MTSCWHRIVLERDLYSVIIVTKDSLKSICHPYIVVHDKCELMVSKHYFFFWGGGGGLLKWILYTLTPR